MRPGLHELKWYIATEVVDHKYSYGGGVSEMQSTAGKPTLALLQP